MIYRHMESDDWEEKLICLQHEFNYNLRLFHRGTIKDFFFHVEVFLICLQNQQNLTYLFCIFFVWFIFFILFFFRLYRCRGQGSHKMPQDIMKRSCLNDITKKPVEGLKQITYKELSIGWAKLEQNHFLKHLCKKVHWWFGQANNNAKVFK